MPITNVGSTWAGGNLQFFRSVSSTRGRVDFIDCGHKVPVRDLTGDTTLLAEDSGFTYICDNSSDTLTVTLPSVASTGLGSTAPSTDRGIYYTIINANTTGARVDVIASSTQFVNGYASSTPFAITAKHGRATIICAGITGHQWKAEFDPTVTT